MLSETLTGNESLGQDFEPSSASRRLVRSVSQRLRKKKSNIGGSEGEGEGDVMWASLRCLSLYGRGGGCKVRADTGEEFGDVCGRRRSNASDEGKGCGTEEAGVDCFSERFWKKHNRKEFETVGNNNRTHVFLPDDILEMCLVRLPLASLMTARLVCKKWRQLTCSSRFMEMRREGSYRSPWLFMFGGMRDGYCSGEIHALDIAASPDGRWHKIDSSVLKGRFMFSVVTCQDDIYIVGGCSSLANFGKVDRSSFKTHKGVIAFSPLTRSWRKVAPMKYARSAPVLGVFAVTPDFSVAQSRQIRRPPRARVGGVSDVYQDPHRLSLRRSQHVDDNRASLSSNRKHPPLGFSRTKRCSRFLLIAVGGHGSWDELLDSGEMYDSQSNKWTEIQRLPVDIGVVCSGVVCDWMFYVYSDSDKLAGYDIERGLWVRVQTTSPFPPRVLEYYPKLVSCDGRLFVFCVSWCEGDGQIGRRNKAVRKLWELDLYYLTWTEVSVHPDAPMDWNASFTADHNLIFGVEMFKIFGQVLDFLTVCDVSDPGMKWSHISRNHHVTHEFDGSSKCMAVLRL